MVGWVGFSEVGVDWVEVTGGADDVMDEVAGFDEPVVWSCLEGL